MFMAKAPYFYGILMLEREFSKIFSLYYGKACSYVSMRVVESNLPLSSLMVGGMTLLHLC